MPFTLDSVVPWGRSLDEYVAMFDLSSGDLGMSTLGCADGPASFNAEMRVRGRTVLSVDPLYQFPAEEIRSRIDATYPIVLEQLRRNMTDYVWTRIPSPEALGALRIRSMETFLEDYPRGRDEGRYVTGSLPRLPFADASFDIALCSHFLFLYSDSLTADFHAQSVAELLRVGREVRIFPLLTLAGRPSPHVDSVCDAIRRSGRRCEIERVDYEFQRGANEMLRIW